MSSDPIADMLVIIKNGGAAKLKEAAVTHSKMKLEILAVLKRLNFIEDYKDNKNKITVKLKYFDGKEFPILGLKRVSKPGLRVYKKSKNIPSTLSGKGYTIVTTSSGIMTDKEAKAKKLGGEVLFKIW